MPSPTPDNKDLFSGVPERIANLVVRYYDANLSEQESAELREGLEQSAAARDLFVRWGLQMQTLTEALAPQYSEADDSIPFEQLVEMESNAHAELVDLDASASQHTATASEPTHASATLAMRDIRSASSYLFRHALTNRFVIGSAIAAVLLLALILLNPFAGNTPDPQEIANNTPTDPAPPIQRDHPVATLTAAHNAQWAEGALAPGSRLHPNQRLTLTAGFAEITTNRGAIAILEAPATIELLDNNNALRLHSGKIVGICETESSEGFLVRTPHMDVTDLGTRFGVNVTDSFATEVHVFEGEVQVSMQAGNDLGEIPKRLTAGHAVRAEATAGEFVSIAEDRSRFASINLFEDATLPRGATEAGLSALRGDVQWSPASAYIDTDRSLWQPDDKVFVFEELSDYRLGADAPVSLAGPGSSADIDPSLPSASIKSGMRVRSYILLLYPQSRGQDAQPRGAITFQGEVLGIATRADQSGVLGKMVRNQGRLVPLRNSNSAWIDIDDPTLAQDVVALGDDGRTVTFAFSGGAGGTDAVRVFVRVPED